MTIMTTMKTKNRVLHDLDGMPEWQKNREYLARLLTNLIFVMSDVLEQLWKECEECNYAAGYVMKQEEKRSYNGMMKNLRALRGCTRYLPEAEQVSFGDDAELTLDLLYAAVTRTGTDTVMMHRFLEYIMSFPDKIGLDGVRQGGEAFTAIKMSQAKGRMEAKGYGTEGTR